MLDIVAEVRELRRDLDKAIGSVLESGAFIGGPTVQSFEQEAAEYLNVKHAVGLNSGTDALTIGLRALGVKSGDEVITSPFSFFATAESISITGAKPVFVDVFEPTMNLHPEFLEKAVTSRTKAILPVHLFGRPAPMSSILKIAEKFQIPVLEDCAQSFGAAYQGVKTGGLASGGAFSFYPTKNLGTYGDGGLFTTNDEETARVVRMLGNHGSAKRYHNELLGYNSRLDALQAAILRVKLPYVEMWNAARRGIAERYNRLLKGTAGLVLPEVSEGHIFHQYTIRITHHNRDVIQQKLSQKGISSMIYYPIPIHQLEVYSGQYGGFPVSEMLSTQVLSLPIWPQMGRETQERIVEALISSLFEV